MRVEDSCDIQMKVMAEVEGDLISERSREGLARTRAGGRKLGRPGGAPSVTTVHANNVTSALAR